MPNRTWEAWWPKLYTDKEKPTEYPGGSESYVLAGEFLAGDALVEEWGCATTFGKQFIPAPYRGVDGGPSKFVDIVADLTEYKSTVPNALIRHVLEHNWEWRTILRNFLESFTHRGVVILFIPMGRYDINRSFENRIDEPPSPPGLQLDGESFFAILDEHAEVQIAQDFTLKNETPPFGYERIFFLEKEEKEAGKDVFRIPFYPECGHCGDYTGTEQVRANFEIGGSRYEIAYNYCSDCLKQMKEMFYALHAVPEVKW